MIEGKEISFRWSCCGTPESGYMKHTNIITLWFDSDGCVNYRRRYVPSDDGPPDADGYEHRFGSEASVIQITKQINWGCSGVSRNPHQVPFLMLQVRRFTEGKFDEMETCDA
jgi:hypothetical protein